jgi:hypothetical protein
MNVTIQDRTGSTEVTVWPDILKNTEELWNINSPVAIHGKVRGQGERLTVSCESVETLEMNTTNSKENNKLRETETQSSPSPKENPPTSKIIKTETPNSALEKQSGSTPEENLPTPEIIKTETPNSAPGHQNDSSSLPVKVTLELRETDNKDLDVNILTQLVGILREFPGNDLVHLNIIVADQRIDVIMPQKAQFNDKFRQEVENILGEGKMSIQRQLI